MYVLFLKREHMNQPSEEQQIIINLIIEGQNVIVDACAGSGKSTTILSAAIQIPDKRFLQITYNASLRKEVKEKVREHCIKNLTVHTYHSLAVAKYTQLAHTDTGIRHLLHENLSPSTPIKCQQIIVLDETQDMTLLYFKFIVKFMRDMGTPFQLMILGDYMQGLYEFKGADIRFLTHADQIWQNMPQLLTPHFAKCTLKMSYRITQPMADFVNEAMLGEHRLLACKEGEPVIYIRDSMYRLQNSVVFYIRALIAKGVNPSQIFVLGASVKGPNSQIRKIENALSEAGIPCHVPMFENDKIDEKVMEGKVVFSTFHCVKGRQREYVFVVGFDQSYFSFFAQTLDQQICPNTLYVACTRATKQLFLLESGDNAHDMPLTFLKFTHHEMKQKPYITFKGQPRTIFYEKEENLLANKVKIHQTTPTDLIKFIPEPVLEEISPLLSSLFVKESEETPELNIPTIVKTKEGYYEDVGDLNGIAIPAMYYDYIRNKWSRDGVDTCLLYELIDDAVENLRGGSHYFLRNIVDELEQDCETMEDYLYMANVYVAIQEKLYFKLKQIGRDEYGWLTADVLAKCKRRLLDVLEEECNASRPEIERTIIHKLDLDAHAPIDECLREYFSGDLFRFTARIDLMTQNTMWEIKCTSIISQDHMLQVIIYAWIMRTLDTRFSKSVKIFNIKTGEILRLDADKAMLDKIMVLLLKGKYAKQMAPTTETFIEDCVKY